MILSGLKNFSLGSPHKKNSKIRHCSQHISKILLFFCSSIVVHCMNLKFWQMFLIKLISTNFFFFCYWFGLETKFSRGIVINPSLSLTLSLSLSVQSTFRRAFLKSTNKFFRFETASTKTSISHHNRLGIVWYFFIKKSDGKSPTLFRYVFSAVRTRHRLTSVTM